LALAETGFLCGVLAAFCITAKLEQVGGCIDACGVQFSRLDWPDTLDFFDVVAHVNVLQFLMARVCR
jgi:hypothetical protein